MMNNKQFQVEKLNFSKGRFIESEMPECAEGEVILEVEKYALTANNITYAAIGFQMKYWNFFPVDETWGLIPVWGFARVKESKFEGIKEGDRFYGYYPMANFLKVKVGRHSALGFFDMTDYRQDLAPIYNNYVASKIPQLGNPIDDFIPVVRPLFGTAFLHHQYMLDADFYGADQVIFTSASSKTALGMAQILYAQKEALGKSVVGITSARNIDFVKKTGFYDEVIAYEEIAAKIKKAKSVVIDLAGNGKILKELDTHLQELLPFISLIGLTDYMAYNPGVQLENAKFFFAPTQAQKLNKEWGGQKLQSEMQAAMVAFIKSATHWMKIEHVSGEANLEEVYGMMVQGKIDPSLAYVIKN